jgi:hypothetical protein
MCPMEVLTQPYYLTYTINDASEFHSHFHLIPIILLLHMGLDKAVRNLKHLPLVLSTSTDKLTFIQFLLKIILPTHVCTGALYPSAISRHT